jgi:hypothetical protein
MLGEQSADLLPVGVVPWITVFHDSPESFRQLGLQASCNFEEKCMCLFIVIEDGLGQVELL